MWHITCVHSQMDFKKKLGEELKGNKLCKKYLSTKK